MKKFLVVGALLAIGACSSGPPERPVHKVEGNVVFHLAAHPDEVEIRLELSFYPKSGYEVVWHLDGTAAEITQGITVVLDGVRDPLEAGASHSPASALIQLKTLQSIDGITWPLKITMPLGDGISRTDDYVVRHTAAGWKLSKQQGMFTRYEPQGSY